MSKKMLNCKIIPSFNVRSIEFIIQIIPSCNVRSREFIIQIHKIIQIWTNDLDTQIDRCMGTFPSALLYPPTPVTFEKDASTLSQRSSRLSPRH